MAPRGEAEWVRNVRASGVVTLRRGTRRESLRARALADGEKPPVLKAYLDAFRTSVQRFFPIPAGSAPDAFAPLAPGYPVFELLPEGPR